jgi:hypothetical protein
MLSFSKRDPEVAHHSGQSSREHHSCFCSSCELVPYIGASLPSCRLRTLWLSSLLRLVFHSKPAIQALRQKQECDNKTGTRHCTSVVQRWPWYSQPNNAQSLNREPFSQAVSFIVPTTAATIEFTTTQRVVGPCAPFTASYLTSCRIAVLSPVESRTPQPYPDLDLRHAACSHHQLQVRNFMLSRKHSHGTNRCSPETMLVSNKLSRAAGEQPIACLPASVSLAKKHARLGRRHRTDNAKVGAT